MVAQHSPDLIPRDISQRFGHQPACPSREALGRRLVKLGQDPPLRQLVVAGPSPSPRLVDEPVNSKPGEPTAPLADRSRAQALSLRNRQAPLAFGRRQDDPSSQGQSLFRLRVAYPLLQPPTFVPSEHHRRRQSAHVPKNTI